MNRRTRMVTSLFTNILYGILSIGINFVTVPFIVGKLGSEAYGFNSISDNFVTYITIITTALNYMGNRFIALYYHKGKVAQSNKYYSSLLFGDIILSVVVGVISILIVWKLPHIITIPPELVQDVRITFALTFLSFLIQIIATPFNAGVYVKDRMDLYGIRNIIYTLIRVGVLLTLYICLPAQIYYISLSVLIGNVFNILFDIISTKKLLPELKIKIKDFESKYVQELLTSGGWYSFVSLGGVLSSGLDLLIANQMVSAYSMGILSVSKTIPGALSSIKSTITGVFRPRMVEVYSKENKDVFVKQTQKYMKVIYAIMSVPLAGIVVYADSFYGLWLPTYTNSEILLVTQLTMWGTINLIVNTLIVCIPEIFALINKLKVASIVNVVENVVSLILTFLLLLITDKGVLVIASVSTIVNMIYQFTFGAIYITRLIGVKWWTFYPTIFQGMFLIFLQICMFGVVKELAQVHSWISFFVSVLICLIVGYCLAFLSVIKNNNSKAVFFRKGMD